MCSASTFTLCNKKTVSICSQATQVIRSHSTNPSGFGLDFKARNNKVFGALEYIHLDFQKYKLKLNTRKICYINNKNISLGDVIYKPTQSSKPACTFMDIRQ